jgi:hypothetical protein
MRWEKLGLLYAPEPVHPKLRTHAANPLALPLSGDVFRVFFGGRDAANRTSVGCVDVDVARRSIVTVHRTPAFEHGAPGSFYADGVSIGCCYETDGRRYMLFMGWQTPPDAHWRGDIGRLVVERDLSLRLDNDTPLMSVAPTDPVSLSYPWVLRDDGGVLRMWYGSTLTWDAGNGEMVHVIQHARSLDGHHWDRTGLAVPYVVGKYQAFSRPTVARARAGGYDMWFSYRSGSGQTYRIGYAYSHDGEHWEVRLDETGIDVSSEGWDSEMIEYPFVFDHGGSRYMLYNGNGYGRTGFGLAILSG